MLMLCILFIVTKIYYAVIYYLYLLLLLLLLFKSCISWNKNWKSETVFVNISVCEYRND